MRRDRLGRHRRIGGPSWGKCSQCGEQVWRASSAEWGKKCRKCSFDRALLRRAMMKDAIIHALELMSALTPEDYNN